MFLDELLVLLFPWMAVRFGFYVKLCTFFIFRLMQLMCVFRKGGTDLNDAEEREKLNVQIILAIHTLLKVMNAVSVTSIRVTLTNE